MLESVFVVLLLEKFLPTVAQHVVVVVVVPQEVHSQDVLG